MCFMSREITYCEAINEALYQEMSVDDSVFTYGIGVPDHKKVFGSTDRLLEAFGPERCLDTPLSEDALMGFGVGAAINGLKPVYVHIRVDFLLLAMNQICNMATVMPYCTSGKLSAPMVIRSVIGRGWGQGCQHSKSMQSVFAHVPGLKVVMPTTPYDVKGMMISAIRDPNPVLVLEHRWLYWQKGEVPEESYEVPIGTSSILREGTDITLFTVSWMGVEAAHAAKILEQRGVSVEIVDARCLSPFDDSIVVNSVKKTKKCLIADNDWVHCGFSAEVAARVGQECWSDIEMPIERVGFTFTPCPTARHLENEFYPNAEMLVRKIESMLGLSPTDLSGESFYSHENRFKGPF